MADEKKIVVDMSVKGQKSITDTSNSLKQLKADLKAAQAAALNGDGAAAKRVAELKDKMEDLRDATKTLQGSGVEKANTSFSLLGEGLANFDFDKIKTGFSGIGNAMKAIPLMLIVEGVRYLIDNWKELSEGNGVLAKSLRAIGEVFSWIGDMISEVANAVTDFLGLTSDATRAIEKQGEAIKSNAEESQKALAATTAEYDRQIKVAQAAGKNTVALEKAKQEAIVQTNVTIARQIEAFVRAGGVLDDEKKKLLTASLEAIKTAKTEEAIIEIKDNKEKVERAKDLADKKKEIADKATDAMNKALEEDNANSEKEQAKRDADAQKKKEEDQKEFDRVQAAKAQMQAQEIKDYETELAFKNKLRADDLAREKAYQAARYQFAAATLNSIQGVSDAFFAIRSSKLKKGSIEEQELARKQFNINKGLQIAQATMQGVQAVQAAFASGLATPLIGPATGAIFATMAGIAAAANVAKIAAMQFQPTGGGASTDLSSASAGSISIPTEAPRTSPISNQAPPSIQPNTYLGDNPNQAPLKAYVVETEQTNAQRRVSRLESQATF